MAASTIPEHFKQNTELQIEVFGYPVQVTYRYYWLGKRPTDGKEPLVSHIEFRSASNIISETGYRSHFFPTGALGHTDCQSIAELVSQVAKELALEKGYQPPEEGNQLTLF